jgi:hypothetical protein
MSEPHDKTNAQEQSSLQEDDQILDKKLGLLDFYSSRAVAHASFFIASIFGLIAFSTITSDALKINGLFYIPAFLLFFGLAYFGYYALMRFGFYANIAELIARDGLQRNTVLKSIKIGDKASTLDVVISDESRKQNRLLTFYRIRQRFESMQIKKEQERKARSKNVNQEDSEFGWSNLLMWSAYWSLIILLSILVFNKYPIEIAIFLLGLSFLTTIVPAYEK